jgi:large subunit ribosomal protein L23
MDLTNYQIVKGLVISNKAFVLNKKYNKLVLRVHPEATKSQIKTAVEKLFGLKTTKINVLLRKGKMRTSRTRSVSVKPLRKFAIVTLGEGYRFDLLNPVEYVAQSDAG